MDLLAPLAGWIHVAALAIVPGYAVTFALFPEGLRRTGFHGLALALGPPLLGVVSALALLAGAPAAIAPWFTLAFAAICGGIGVGRRRGTSPLANEPVDVTGFRFALCVALVCAAFPLLFEWWRVSSDAWTHEGVVRAVVRDGLPPGDPWYAGRTLRYAWVYHVAAAALASVRGPDVFSVLAGFTVLAAASTVLSAASLAALWSPGARGWSLTLLVLGLNALFPVFLPLQLVRAVSGEVRGLEALREVFNLQPFGWDRAGALLRSLGGQDFFLNKFLVATPLALALAGYTAWIETVARTLQDPRPRLARGVGAFALVVTAGLMHPVVGLDLAALIGVLGIASFALFRGDGRRRLLGVLVPSALGVLPVAWFILTFVRTGEGGHAGLPVDLAPLKLLGLVTCLALGLTFAVRGVIHDFGAGDGPRLRAVLVGGGLLIALAIRLPGPSPFFTVDKFSYLVWIPLALAAGAPFARYLRERSVRVRVLLVLLLFVPVNGLALVARLADSGTAVRQPWKRLDFRWMRDTLPPDAVLLVPPRDVDIAVFAQRDQYYGVDADAQLRGIALEEITTRRGLVQRLYEDGTLSADGMRRLGALGRPVYAVWTNRTADFWRRTPGTWSQPFVEPGPPAAWDHLGRVLRQGEDVTVIEVVAPP